mgnify:CR=1 FL=1
MPISHSGYGRSAPRDDRSYVCKKSGKSATAISTAVVATATEAGQEQNPDQPFATIISAATVVFIAQKSAAVVVSPAAAAAEKQDDPDAAVAEDTVTTVVIVAAGIIVAATVCSS